MDTALIIITLGSFIASFVNAAFATGGIYILLATSSSIFPLTVAIPLQSVLAFGSLLARVGFFWRHIHWPIVFTFGFGSLFGVYFGAKVFVSTPEHIISIGLGVLLLVMVWLPLTRWRLPIKHPFVFVGAIHSFIGMIMGVGGFLQASVLRTDLVKMQVTGTLAAGLVIMDVLKITGYVSHGFRYQDFAPHIILATIAGFAGTWAGKRVTHKVSERAFRLVFKWLITIVAMRLFYRGWVLMA